VNALAPEASPRGSPPAPTRRPLPYGPLVVVAGIPGAGKSTALEAVAEELRDGTPTQRRPEPVVLDSAEVRCWLRSRLPRLPYPVFRPVVHAVHWARIAALSLTEPRPLVIHETATRPLARQALWALARGRRRPVRLVWIDVPARAALLGQIDRCRVIRPHAFARHLHRVEREHPATATRRTWDAVRVTDRDNAPAAIITACTAPAG
jgi:predicted kinase